MKKLIFSFLIFAFLIPFMSSCSTDIHYDSVSAEITLAVPDIPKDGSSVIVHQRFQFDRDLAPISSMTLVEAWLSGPVSDPAWKENHAERIDSLEDSFALDIVQSINISLIESDNTSPVFWMLIPSSQLKNTDALFSDFNVGDLRQYMDRYQQLELQIDIQLDPYHTMRYWRDVCNMETDCKLHLPLSMQFKMED